MATKTQADIPFSQLDYTSEFKKPIVAVWPPGKLIEEILEALRPWGYTYRGVETNLQTNKLDEFGFTFRRTTPVAPAQSLTLGLGRVAISAQNLDWTEAEQFITSQSAALDAVRRVGGAELESQHVLLGMHIQLKDKSRKDVTAPLLSPMASQLFDGQPEFSGVILSREHSMIVIDASVGLANSLFVRISRTHPGDLSFAGMAKILHEDEQRIFDALGLEGIL